MKHLYSLKAFLFDATSFAHQHLAIICQSSPHLFTSQGLSGWMGADAHFQVSPEIFDWVQSQAVAGQLKDIELYISHSWCVLRVIVLLEGEPSAQSEVLNALDWVFIKAISIFCCTERSFYSDESLSPCHWKTAPQHEPAARRHYFWDGTPQVMSRAGFLQTLCLELRFIRPENLVSQSLRVL